MSGKPFKLDLLNLGGGLNDGVAPSHIQDNEFSKLANFYPFGSKLTSRRGSVRITSSAYGERLTSIFRFKKGTANWQLIVGTRSGIARLSGTVLVPLAIATGTTISASDEPWRFIQYQNEMIAVRRASGLPKRVTEDVVMDAGIPAPSAAPTLCGRPCSE